MQFFSIKCLQKKEKMYIAQLCTIEVVKGKKDRPKVFLSGSNWVPWCYTGLRDLAWLLKEN